MFTFSQWLFVIIFLVCTITFVYEIIIPKLTRRKPERRHTTAEQEKLDKERKKKIEEEQEKSSKHAHEIQEEKKKKKDEEIIEQGKRLGVKNRGLKNLQESKKITKEDQNRLVLKEQRKNAQKALSEVNQEEPSPSANTSLLLIRLPSGVNIKRRFYISNTIDDVTQYIDGQDDNVGVPLSFSLVTPFPTRVLSSPIQTIQELGLFPNSTVYVRDNNT